MALGRSVDQVSDPCVLISDSNCWPLGDKASGLTVRVFADDSNLYFPS